MSSESDEANGDATEPDVREAKDEFILLRDEPSLTDSFGHQRVADVIANVVETQPGPGAIALEGGWGSGKSTTVKLLEGKLRSSTNAFVFDAWAHQGDSLRRSFLEGLIKFLSADERRWIPPEEGERELSELRRRERTIDTETTVTTSAAGRIVGALSPLVAVGIALLAWALAHAEWAWRGVALLLIATPIAAAFAYWIATTRQFGGWRWPYLGLLLVSLAAFFLLTCSLSEDRIAGVGLAMGLLLGPVAPVVHWSRLKPTSGDSPEGQERKGDPPVGPFSLVDRWSTANEKSSVSEDTEPTSVEFEEKFDELLSAALGTEVDRRLLIVLDNLDRVDVEDARITLATMQPFIGLRPSASHSRGPMERVWFLIPFDPDGLKALWATAIPDSSGSTGGARPARSFIEKLFVLRIPLPPLTTIRWRDHLALLLDKSLQRAILRRTALLRWPPSRFLGVMKDCRPLAS